LKALTSSGYRSELAGVFDDFTSICFSLLYYWCLLWRVSCIIFHRSL
jgi:hypothetical protein